MLRRRDGSAPVAVHRPDPVAGLSAVLLGLICVALFLAAILAVYDYNTPGAEAPLVVGIAVLFFGTILVNVVAATVRHLRGWGR